MRDIDVMEHFAQGTEMVRQIQEALPSIEGNSAHFHKSHSQWMVATLDITALTPIRSIKHTLAEISKTRNAIEEAYVKRMTLDVDETEAAARLDGTTGTARTRIEILRREIAYKKKSLDDASYGAIRKLAHLCAIYTGLLSHIGREKITEAEYEAEEARYHVLTCLKQALCAARARGGVIDEGNHIYLFDMGMPSALIQQHVSDYLRSEKEMVANGAAPSHEYTVEWMNSVADTLEPFAKKNADRRGMTVLDRNALAHGSEQVRSEQING